MENTSDGCPTAVKMRPVGIGLEEASSAGPCTKPAGAGEEGAGGTDTASLGCPSWPRLSWRQSVILRCLIEGRSNKLIAHELTISEGTVKVHIKLLLRKLGLHNRTQAAIWAMNHESLIATPAEAERVRRI